MSESEKYVESEKYGKLKGVEESRAQIMDFFDTGGEYRVTLSDEHPDTKRTGVSECCVKLKEIALDSNGVIYLWFSQSFVIKDNRIKLKQGEEIKIVSEGMELVCIGNNGGRTRFRRAYEVI